MEIYILRHGIAQDGRPGHPDSERALTPEGRTRLRAVLRRAREAGAAPSLVLSSPYRRALQTAEEAVEVLGCRNVIEQVPALEPDGSAGKVWDEIRAHRQEPAVLLSGHEPLLSIVVAYLLGAPALLVDMKKAALVRVDCDSFGPQPHGVLKWMLTPRLAAEK
jgi:phosphohistidine phosphatase